MSEIHAVGTKWEHRDQFGNNRIAEVVAHHNGQIVVKLYASGYYAVPPKSLHPLTPSREMELRRRI